MKELHGSATAEVATPPGRCREFLADVERYPEWHPEVVRSVSVVERDGSGRATVVQAQLRAPGVPLRSDFDLRLAVEQSPDGVALTRIPHGSDDPERFAVHWLTPASPLGTRLQVDLRAELSVPRLVPLGGLGERFASGFLAAATDALGQDPA